MMMVSVAAGVAPPCAVDSLGVQVALVTSRINALSESSSPSTKGPLQSSIQSAVEAATRRSDLELQFLRDEVGAVWVWVPLCGCPCVGAVRGVWVPVCGCLCGGACVWVPVCGCLCMCMGWGRGCCC